MTIQLEKVFFNYILQNKKYYAVVEPFFFKNVEVQYVYNVLRKYMSKGNDIDVPTPRQIFEMVGIEDKDGIITKEIFKQIFKVSLNEFDEVNFIIPKFNAWILGNRLKKGTVDIIEQTRDVDNISDLQSAINAANKIKSIVEIASSTNFVDDDDLGSDFDDVEHHIQDSSKFKVKCGFESIDHMLGGGWDIGTLNCIMAETNNGKSLWMQNFAVKCANMGYNVLYYSLEMSERKVMKRLGAMRLKIPINNYDDLSKDTNYIAKRIKDIKKASSGELFDGASKFGKIIVKFKAAGTATISDIDDYLLKLKEKKGVKIDLIIVDYITLLAPIKGIGIDNNLYMKGKHLAEGLRAVAAKYGTPLITGVQVAKDAWNSTDITLEQVPESKAIAETADTFFAIIRTEEMKRQNLYRFKLLKQRDGDFLRSQIRINLNPTFLTLEDDIFLDNV
jgi:replicative DNA helicase